MMVLVAMKPFELSFHLDSMDLMMNDLSVMTMDVKGIFESKRSKKRRSKSSLHLTLSWRMHKGTIFFM